MSDHESQDPLAPTVDLARETRPLDLEAGIAIALRAEDGGSVSPLNDWLACHPDLAGELASFLSANRGLHSALGPARCVDPDNLADSWHLTESVAGFELRGEIGRGGMGVVYRAFDTSLKREVALKRVLTGPLSSPADEARFRFEAEAVASLDHPAIVRVHASGESDGTLFLVMPLMEGGSLAQKLRDLGPDRRLPPKEAARLVRDIALGVHHAHQRGLLHRDLKPANILLDREGRPHVADFGLARSIGVASGASLSAGPVGTVSYMAPEQSRGERGLTTAVDTHALGAILYELLVGSPPFGTDGWLDVLRRVQEEAAPSIRRVRPDVPIDLESITLRCLAKHPEDRYESALDLAEDLARFLDGEPIGRSRKRGWLANISRAFERRRETLSMASYAGFFWAAGVTAGSMLIVQALVIRGVSGWWSYAMLAANMVGWAILYWWFLILRMAELSPVERLSSALKLGMMLSVLALIPAQIAESGADLLPLFQPMTVILGLAGFAHGATHWGRLYLVGVMILAVAALMPLAPMLYWPTIYGSACVVSFCWVGYCFRAFDRESRPGSLERLIEPNDTAPTGPFSRTD